MGFFGFLSEEEVVGSQKKEQERSLVLSQLDSPCFVDMHGRPAHSEQKQRVIDGVC